MINQIAKDIFEADIDILVHSANCMCIMGGGIARQIAQKFPEAQDVDNKTVKGDKRKLGTYSSAKVNHARIKYIVNLYGQYDISSSKRMTSYDALVSGMEELKAKLIEKKVDNLTIGFPYKLGSGLGGGNWRVVKTIIEEVWADYPGQIFICKHPDFD